MNLLSNLSGDNYPKPSNDYLKFICDHEDSSAVQAAVVNDENFWPTVLSQLKSKNLEIKLSKGINREKFKEKIDDQFNTACRLIRFLINEKESSVFPQNTKRLIRKALNKTKSVAIKKRFEILLALAEEAKVKNKIMVCVNVLDEIDEEIKRLESDIERLYLNDEYKEFLNDINRRYQAIEQGLYSPENVLSDVQNHFILDDQDQFEFQDDSAEPANKKRRLTYLEEVLGDLETENEGEKNNEVDLLTFDELIGSAELGESVLTEGQIHNAARENQSSYISDLYFLFPEVIHIKDAHGSTPFIIACANNSFDAAYKLLELGVDLHDKDNCGRSALIHLMKAEDRLNEEEYSKQFDLFKKLIDSNDQVFAFDIEGKSALHWAIMTGKEKCALELIKLIDEDVQTSFLEDILFLSCKYNANELITYILNQNKIDLRRIFQPLFTMASYNKNGTVIYNLIRAGLSFDIRQVLKEEFWEENEWAIEQIFLQVISQFTDSAGRTPLMIACDHHDFETASVLVGLSADIQEKDPSGRSALIHLMKSEGSLDEEESVKQYYLFKKLISLDHQLFAVDNEGKSALHWAIITGKEKYALEMVDLIDEGTQTSFLEDIFYLSCQCNSKILIEYLSNNKIRRNSVETFRRGYENKDAAVIYSLVKAGINVQELVKENISEGDNVDAIFHETISRFRDNIGRTPLMIALDNNDFDTAFILSALGADLKEKDQDGSSALIHLMKNQAQLSEEEFSKQFLLFEQLTFSNDQIFDVDNEGKSAFHWAIITGKEKYVIELATLIDTSQVELLEMALIQGCQYQLDNLISYLLCNKCSEVDLSRVSKKLVELAFVKKNPEFVYLLLRAGITLRREIDQLWPEKDTKSKEKIFKEMISRYLNDAGMTPLMIACARGDFDVALRLLNLKVVRKKADFNGHTALFHFLKNPLQISLRDGHWERDEVFKQLRLVRSLFWPDNEGKSVLDWAIISGKKRYAWQLFTLIDENTPRRILESALEFGCQHNLKYVVKKALKKKDLFLEEEFGILKIVLSHKNADLFNVLFKAGLDLAPLFNDICEKQNYQALEFLIKNKFYPSDLRIEGFPLIHWLLITCCRLGEKNPLLFNLAEEMIQHNADFVHIRDNAGCTVLHAAVMARHENLVKLLLRLGADINDEANDYHATPLTFALDHQSNENDEIVKILRNKLNEKDIVIIE